MIPCKILRFVLNVYNGLEKRQATIGILSIATEQMSVVLRMGKVPVSRSDPKTGSTKQTSVLRETRASLHYVPLQSLFSNHPIIQRYTV